MFARLRVSRLRPRPTRLLALLLACALLLPALVVAPPTAAANCTVSSPLNDGYGSLRLLLANTSCTSIDFGVPEVRVSSYLTVNRSVTIQGAGKGATTIRYAGDFSYTGSVIYVSAGTVSFNDLQIAGGRTIGLWGAGLGIVGHGSTTVTLRRVKVADNVAREAGGGGIYASNATLSIIDSNITANSSPNYAVNDGWGGGGLFLDDYYGSVISTLNNVEIVNNASYNNMGGGIRVWHRSSGKSIALSMTGGSIRFNSASWGGGIFNGGGSVNLNGTTVMNNSAQRGGGGIYNYNGPLSLYNATLDQNEVVGTPGSTQDHGGGLYNYYGTATLSLTTVTLNKTNNYSSGGGIYNSYSTLIVDRSTIERNAAGQWGGGIYSQGTLSVAGSTISGNRANQAGGAIMHSGGPITMTNTTVGGNTAGQVAAGLSINPSGSSILTAVTITQNRIDNTYSGHAAGLNVGGSGVQLRQSLIAGNYAGAVASNCVGPIQSLGDNLVAAGTGCPGNGTGDLAYTGGLSNLVNSATSNSGGPTKTYNLPAGSAAIDRVPAARCAVGSDQRGIDRPQGAGCDSGAVEYRP